MLINKSLAKAYIDVISVDSKIKQILKYGKPWGNGEDILISALSMFLHNKQNTYIQTNLTDTGIHCQDAVSVRSGQQHYDYRKMVQDNWAIDRINYTKQYNKPLYFYEWLYKNLTSEELKLVSRELFKCECCRIHSYILSDKNKTSEMLDFKQWVDG